MTVECFYSHIFYLEKKMKKIVYLIIVSTVLLAGCSKAVTTSLQTDSKCKGWGFRRTPYGPEFTGEQISEMTKYDCIYREDTEEKVIYLTFDEGYENGYTSLILDVLREKDVKAAFFVTAPYVKTNPDLIERMSREGHIIGNHTVNHPSLPSVTDAEAFERELTELDRLIYGISKKHTKYLRPPKGEYSTNTLALSKKLGYTNVFWSDTYVDWNNDVSASDAHDKVTSRLHTGEVLLLHAVSKGNADALAGIIDTARKKGYVFKSLDSYKKSTHINRK